MNVVIAGAGKVGYFLAKELMEENEVTLIDSNEKTIQNIDDTLDVLSIYGDVEDPYTYRNIKKDIDLFIAVTDSDEINLLSSLIIDNIVNVKEKIVRLKNDFFMSDKIKERLNITDIITPAIDVAKTFNYLIDFPHANNVKTFDYTKALLLAIRIHPTFEPLTIEKFRDNLDNKLIIAGIDKGDKFFVPNDLDMLMPNDLIYIFAFPSLMSSIRVSICKKQDKQDIKNCIIYGANQLGLEIAKVLIKRGLNIKLIDRNLERCKHANTVLKNNVEVIKSNYNLDFLLDSHGVNANIFIAATTNDEFNITKCMEANQKGIEKVIGIHNNRQYASLMRKLNIEVIRGEKMNAYYSILEKVTSNKIVSQRVFCGGEGTMFMRKIFANSKFLETKPELNDKIYGKGTFYIQRDKKFLFYKNTKTLQVDDIIICFCLAKNAKVLKNWLKQGENE
ncbi:NAD-binding protein [Sulfurospirillum arcachonense]|uniref:NAD-binding protein n=1 Tax=Sulfurospirillum arcachonense TaxID=57666 RepID=UPI00046A53AF|nr:NAD-binding protein [Sulfurospirillum arcachonense]